MDYKKYCLNLLGQLVAIPSESQNEEAHAKFLEKILREELGMETELQHAEGKSYNVIGKQNSGKEPAKRKLYLGGHIDTVPKNDRWLTNPYEITIKGDNIYGLGTDDMKGGLASQITVLKHLRDEGIQLDADIEFVGVADEERLSVGANYYAKMKKQEMEKNPQAQDSFFIMGEPHYDNIVVGATGKVLYRVEILGESGHASHPQTGVNAIDCMAELLTAINEKYTPLYAAGEKASHCCLRMESRYPGYSLNIPEECFCFMNKQLYTEESAEEFLEDMKKLYAEKVGRGKLKITKDIPYYPSYKLDLENHDYQSLMKFLKEKYHHEPDRRINQSVSDGNITYVELGIPTILFGPQGADLHKENEYMSKNNMENYLEVLYEYLKSEY